MKKLLVIASHCTTLTAPRGIQGGRLIQQLSKFWKVTLITSNESVAESETSTFKTFSKVEDVVVIQKKPLPIWKRALKMISPFFTLLDSSWTLQAATKAKELHLQTNFDACLILSMPLYNAATAAHLRKQYPNLPIVGFFSDPISLSPYVNKHWLMNALLIGYEKALFSSFDQNVFPSKNMAAKYESLYPWIPFESIAHSFLSNNLEVQKTQIGAERIIRHIGTLNEERSPLPLLKWIVENEIFLKESNVKFEFVGRLNKRLKRKIPKMYFLSDRILFRDSVSYEEAERLHALSACLLVIDADFEESLFLPSKLVESFGFRVPIIGITPSESESERVLLSTNDFVIHYDAFDELFHIIPRILNTPVTQLVNADLRDAYNARNIVNNWNSLIVSVIDRKMKAV